MVISRTPLRISFCGGGTDFPRWYEGRYGCVVGAAITKYVYVIVNPRFEGGVRVAYAGTEELTKNVIDVQHDLVREAMKQTGVIEDIEIVTVADVPGRGTGLGSSSAVTVGVLNALWRYKVSEGWIENPGRPTPGTLLAKQACEIELDILGKPIGKQDQYLCALGGVNCIEFLGDGQVVPEEMQIGPFITGGDMSTIESGWEITNRFCKNLLLFYLGTTRCADDILREQDGKTDGNERPLRGLVHYARMARNGLLNGEFARLGELMDLSWQFKRLLAPGITDVTIDIYYEDAREAGALGGKVCGAGGGGFMLLYVEPEKQAAVREALGDLKELKFGFDYKGSEIIYAD